MLVIMLDSGKIGIDPENRDKRLHPLEVGVIWILVVDEFIQAMLLTIACKPLAKASVDL